MLKIQLHCLVHPLVEIPLVCEWQMFSPEEVPVNTYKTNIAKLPIEIFACMKKQLNILKSQHYPLLCCSLGSFPQHHSIEPTPAPVFLQPTNFSHVIWVGPPKPTHQYVQKSQFNFLVKKNEVQRGVAEARDANSALKCACHSIATAGQ